VNVLATSREGLRVGDEHLWAVPSLDLTDGIESSAAALFVERAAAVRQEVPLTVTSESAAVVEICRQLDGIPLGIELAASRMQSMTATEVRDRLGDRFRLLAGSRRGLERHQTLRHAVAWSYDLLDDDERSVLNRCSVFAGGFDLPGAEAVTGCDDDFATLDLLDALVRKSLMVADHSSGRTGDLRMVRHRAGQSAHSVPMGRRPRRPRRCRHHRHLRGVPRHLHRKLRVRRLGRRVDRASPRCRPSSARVPVRHRLAVLYIRTRRRGCTLLRRRHVGP